MTAPVNQAGLEWVLVALYRNTSPPDLEAFRLEAATHVRPTTPPPVSEMERLITGTYHTLAAAGDCI